MIRSRVHAGPGNRVFCICQPCARDSGNKTAVSAHDMGSGGLEVDAMAIGCLGVDRHGERIFALSHHDFASFLLRDLNFVNFECVSLFYVIDTGSIRTRARIQGDRAGGYLSTLHH